MKKYLMPIYRYIFEETFLASDPHARMKMRHMVYLLQEMAIDFGYAFFWYQNGPYSNDLREDLHSLRDNGPSMVEYTDETKRILDRLKAAVWKKPSCSMDDWVDCLASLHYLKTNVMPDDAADIDVVRELQFRKPYLDSTDEAIKALTVIGKYL